ncbi:MAG: phage holin family protein [Bacillati bacterium ANGP1]|uniref:Phage holin family protein n=1 Tax=Candidatus Segetimicrobium genomatis TaxID=2569760 RepID=A0A537JQB3_9BACT|nr:MAG: phage holin family protein [Terrabacteria group bacterium ANGP1]
MGFVIRWFINAVALYVTTLIVPGVKVPDFGAVLVAALVLGIVNAGMLYLVAGVTHRLRLESFWWALLGAIVLSVASAVISRQVED